MKSTFTVELPSGERRALHGFDHAVEFVRELGTVEKGKRGELLAARMALGAALLQLEQQVPFARIRELYERSGVSRRVGAACKAKASAFADDRGILDPDRVRLVQAKVAEEHKPKPGSRLERLTRLEPDQLSDLDADRLVGYKVLPEGSSVRGMFRNVLPEGARVREPFNFVHPGGQNGTDAEQERGTESRFPQGELGGQNPFAAVPAWGRKAGAVAVMQRGPAGVAVEARQMSLAEAVEAAADAVVARVAELRTHADAATLALLEQVMARLGGV